MTNYKDFKDDEGLTGYMLTWHQPYERSYSPESAYESYRKLSAKYPENPHRIIRDYEAAERVRREVKRETKRNKEFYGHE